VIDVQKMNVQVELLGSKGAKNKKKQHGDEVVGWAIYR
jgi:hypothetical protein